MVYYNPYITVLYNPLYNPTNQGFFIAHIVKSFFKQRIQVLKETAAQSALHPHFFGTTCVNIEESDFYGHTATATEEC